MPDDKKVETPAVEATLLSKVNSETRDAISDRYQEFEAGGKPKEDLKPAEGAETEPKEEPTPPVEKGDEKPKEEPEAEPETVPVATEEKKPKKTVPIEALHEARIELKSLKKDNEELKEQVKVLLEDIRGAAKKPAKDEAPEEPEEFLTDEQKKIRDLEKEVAFIREKDKEREKLRESENIKKDQERTGMQIKETSLALENEGFSGFIDMLPLVTVELNRIAAEDRDEANKLDNPEGWKKIFKETVFPRIASLGQKKSRKEKIEEKEALKTDASLLMPSGSQPKPKEDKEDDYSFESYMKERASRSPQPQNLRGK
jgi:hypothetical protein